MPSRRSFLRQLAAGAVVAPWVTSVVRAQSPNSIVRHATFGAAAMGKSDVTAIAKHPAVKSVAACDVDLGRTTEFRKTFPDAHSWEAAGL